MRDNAPGLLFVTSMVALVSLAVVDLTVVASGSETGYDYGSVHATAERAILSRSVEMRPGDRLLVSPNLGGGWPTIARYDFYVVNGGDVFALLDGNATQETYVQVANMSAQGCCPNERVVWDRPDDAFARREGAPVPQTGPGIVIDERELILGAVDQPGRVSLVWVLSYGPNVTVPAEERARRQFESRLEDELTVRIAFQPAFDPAMPTVYSAASVRAHPWLLWAMAASALVAAGSAIAWTLRLRRARIDEPVPGAESLLRLYDAAGVYLATLRDLLLGSLLIVAAVAFHVALSGEPAPVFSLIRFAGVGHMAETSMKASLVILYAAVAVVWTYAAWHAHTALRRWQRRARPEIA